MRFSSLDTKPAARHRGARTTAIVFAAMALALVASLLPASADVNEVPSTGNQLLAGSLSVGDGHACAAFSTGFVKCWGSNGSGQLGTGDDDNRGDDVGEMGNNLPFVDLGTGRTAVQLSAGRAHTCAIRDDGSVVCWGSNENGKLGIGQPGTIEIGDEPGEMGNALTAVPLPGDAIAISAGVQHTCAIVDGGDLYCWGLNGFGQLGQGNRTTVGTAPGEVAALSPVSLGTGRTAAAVTASNFHTCVLRDDASVVCFGNGGQGRLGTGSTLDVGPQPTQMGDALAAIDLGVGRTALVVTTGQDHTCVLRDDGDVACFGNNPMGQLGLGNTDPRGGDPSHVGAGLLTVPLGTGRTASAIASHSNHNCAQLDDGTVKCWGSNFGGALGQLLDGSNRIGDAPGEMGDNLGPVDVAGDDDTVQLVTVGNNVSCAVVATGDLKCWGNAGTGVIGQGNVQDWGAAGSMGVFLPVIDLGSPLPPTTTTGGGGGTTTTTGGGGGSTTTTTTIGGGGLGGASTTTVPPDSIPICDTSGAGNDFTDIAGSFAEEDINCLNDLGVINGFRPDLFGLKSVLTREQGVAMIARLYRDVLNQDCDSSSHPFADIPAGHYVNVEAACLNDVDLVNGTGATEFGLLQPLSRQQVAAILGRFWLDLGRGCPSLEHPFTDLVEGGYAEPFIACLSNLQDPAGGSIINGRTPTTYDPFATITREEMAALLGRIYRAYLDAIF